MTVPAATHERIKKALAMSEEITPVLCPTYEKIQKRIKEYERAIKWLVREGRSAKDARMNMDKEWQSAEIHAADCEYCQKIGETNLEYFNGGMV